MTTNSEAPCFMKYSPSLTLRVSIRTMSHPFRTIVIACVLIAPSATASAQVVVQQPVVSISSVRTTVAVPDRGQIFLGGVSSAESSRNQLGFTPRGSSLGRSVSSRSSSATVQIIDLREMDEAILQGTVAHAARVPPEVVIDRSLQSGQQASRAYRFVQRSLSEEVLRLESLAQRADERDQPGVAKLHREAAARYRAQSR